MKTISLIILLLLIPASIFAIPADVTDISGRKYAPAVLAELQKAKEEIFVCLYYIRYYGNEGKVKELMNGLVEAHKRGVKVTVILDEGRRKANYTPYLASEKAFAYLLHFGMDVFYDDLKTTTHSKVIVIDGETVIAGSTNWSTASLTQNREVSFVIRSEELGEKVLTGLQEIATTRPVAVTDGIFIPKSFFEDKIGADLIRRKFHTGFDLYLYALKKSNDSGSNKITINEDELKKYVLYKSKDKNRILIIAKKNILLNLQKSGIIKNVSVDYKKGQATFEIPLLKDNAAALK